MTSERLLNIGIKVLYLPKNFYTSPKQISDYAPVNKFYVYMYTYVEECYERVTCARNL